MSPALSTFMGSVSMGAKSACSTTHRKMRSKGPFTNRTSACLKSIWIRSRTILMIPKSQMLTWFRTSWSKWLSRWEASRMNSSHLIFIACSGTVIRGGNSRWGCSRITLALIKTLLLVNILSVSKNFLTRFFRQWAKINHKRGKGS